jgi:hypothetical protein
MGTPQSYIAFAPFGIGVMCALTCFERGNDVYGWWLGARDSEYESACFELEGYFTARPTRFYATAGMDLYGGWRFLYSSRTPQLDKPVPVEDEAAHELDRLQGEFVAEWLFFDDDERARQERIEYDKANFPLRHVNLRPARVGRFDRSEPVWVYRSHDFDMDVLRYLQRYWPLDYRELPTS